jgi:hypothetical protein
VPTETTTLSPTFNDPTSASRLRSVTWNGVDAIGAVGTVEPHDVADDLECHRPDVAVRGSRDLTDGDRP